MTTAPEAGKPSSLVTVTATVAFVCPPWSCVSAVSAVCVARPCALSAAHASAASTVRYPILQPFQAADRGGSYLSRAPAPKSKSVIAQLLQRKFLLYPAGARMSHSLAFLSDSHLVPVPQGWRGQLRGRVLPIICGHPATLDSGGLTRPDPSGLTASIPKEKLVPLPPGCIPFCSPVKHINVLYQQFK